MRLLTCLALAATALGACATDGVTPPPAAAAADPCAARALGCASDQALRAMVANPADLERGTEPAGLGSESAMAAVQRQLLGTVPPLSPQVSTDGE